MFLRVVNYRTMLLSIVLGLVWGIATQLVLTNWRGIPILSDKGWGTALVWLLGLLLLLWRLAPGAAPLALGCVGATFWVSAIIGYYAYYVAMLDLGIAGQGAVLDLGDGSSYRVLWTLFRTSVAQWIGLALLGGFGIGWVWSLALQRHRGHHSEEEPGRSAGPPIARPL